MFSGCCCDRQYLHTCRSVDCCLRPYKLYASRISVKWHPACLNPLLTHGHPKASVVGWRGAPRVVEDDSNETLSSVEQRSFSLSLQSTIARFLQASEDGFLYIQTSTSDLSAQPLAR